MNEKVRSRRWRGPAMAALLFAAGLVDACTAGPNFIAPKAPVLESYGEPAPSSLNAAGVAHGETQTFVPGARPQTGWWGLYESPELSVLVEQALKANPSVAAGKAAVREAMELFKAQAGLGLPALDLTANGSRSRQSAAISPTLASNALLYNLFEAQAGVNWTLDLWGANRRTLEGLKAAKDASTYQLEAVRTALATGVVSCVITSASLNAQIEVTRGAINDQNRILAIVRRQYELGAIPRSDVTAQETALAALEETLPGLRKALEQQRHLLTTLTGEDPSPAGRVGVALSDLKLPQTLPLSLPAQLVEQRADVRIALSNLHAASAAIGVAEAQRLPNIVLTAQAGGTSPRLGDAFSSSAGFWNFGAAISEPLINGGSLRHRVGAAKAQFDVALAQYRGVVGQAFQDVADALSSLRADSETLEATARTRNSADRALDLIRRQLNIGEVSQIAVLNAEQAALQARLAQIAAETARLVDSAALIEALGGDWFQEGQAQ